MSESEVKTKQEPVEVNSLDFQNNMAENVLKFAQKCRQKEALERKKKRDEQFRNKTN